MIHYLGGETKCGWHEQYKDHGKDYQDNEIFPMCPFLYHSLYPYYLGLMFGAKFKVKEDGVHGTSYAYQNVCCPAEKGIGTVIRIRENDGRYDVPKHWKTVIHAEVVRVYGDCPYGHKLKDKFIFPGASMRKWLCPAGLNNIFPFLKLDIPKCINLAKLRCPDWMENIYYTEVPNANGTGTKE